MRKFFAIAVSILLLAACCGTVFADGAIDFSGYTLEELIRIKADLTEEIARRPGGEKIVLGIGQYKVGEAIPAGIYAFRFVQNGDSEINRTDYYVYENESMYKYDVDRLWLGDMPRVDGALKGEGEARISLYPGEYLILRHNGAQVERVGNVSEQASGYEAPQGTSIPKGNYTVGEEIPAGTYRICFNGQNTARVRVFQDADDAGNIFSEGKETILNENNPEGTVMLADGNIHRVEYTPIIMIKGGGFIFD